MLGSNVLVLNRSYLPVQITTIKRAMILLFKGVAKALDKELQTYDFKSWAELSAAVHDDTIGLVGRLIRVPRVIVLTQYNRLPKRAVCFSRYNILLRDDFTCQYCGKRLSKGRLNLDHVVPRSRGGKTSWTNVVTSCHHCNRKKGGFLPHEVGMKLKRVPTKPSAISYFAKNAGKVHYREWLPFLNMIDFSYWNVELEE